MAFQTIKRKLSLLVAKTTDGDGTALRFNGGNATLHIFGTFDGATVTLNGSTDGGRTWTAIAAKTAAYIGPLNGYGAMDIKATISSAGTSSLNCNITYQE